MILISEPRTATVNRVVVPFVNHVSADNPAKKQKYPGAAGQGTAVVKDLSTSSGSSSSEDDIEQYEKEPGIRRPGSRSCSEDLDIDVEEYNEELVPRMQDQGIGREYQAPRKADSGPPAKKTGKKGPRLDVGNENKSRDFADQVRLSPGISEDVWKEAMAGVPLASSESFDTRLLPSAKDRSADFDDDNDDAFERRGRRKGKKTRSTDPVSDLKWSADLPINDSLSRDTLDDISCDSYVPPQSVGGIWDPDLDSPGVIDDYLEEEGTVKVLDMLARSSDSSQGRVVGRRRERDQRKQTPSTSFETNIDDIEFDTEPRGNVSNKVKRPAGNVPNTNQQEHPPEDTEPVNRNVSNINKTKQRQPEASEKEKRRKAKERDNVSNEPKEPTEREKKRRPKQVEPDKEKVGKDKVKKPKEPVSNISQKKSATIPIMSADAAAGSLPFEEDEESYSGEPTQDLSADINIRLWQGQTTNIDDSDDDDEDLTNEDRDELPSNLHDQRLDEDSMAQSDEDKPMSGKPPTSSTSQSTGNKPEIIDRLPDRPRRSQPLAPEEPQTSRQRKPPARNVARRPYNGILCY